MSSAGEETIRDIALKLAEARARRPEEGAPRCLLLLGAPAAGKTTLMNSFLGKRDGPAETLLLEYGYGRRTVLGQFAEKQVCHVWELAGEASLAPGRGTVALSAALRGAGGAALLSGACTVLLVLDLARPAALWRTLDGSVRALRAGINARADAPALRRRARERSGTNELPDDDSLPLQVILVGGKYDLFKNLDSGYRSAANTLMRTAAAQLGAALVFHSNSERVLSARTERLLQWAAFGGTTEPAEDPTGDAPYLRAGGGRPTPGGWDAAGAAFCAMFPQTEAPSSLLPGAHAPAFLAAHADKAVDTAWRRLDLQLQTSTATLLI